MILATRFVFWFSGPRREAHDLQLPIAKAPDEAVLMIDYHCCQSTPHNNLCFEDLFWRASSYCQWWWWWMLQRPLSKRLKTVAVWVMALQKALPSFHDGRHVRSRGRRAASSC